jgi:hypothetical protein
MTMSLHFHAVESAKHRIFNYFACPVTEVNRTAAPAKYTIERSEPIAVMVAPQNNQHQPPDNAQAQRRKALDARIKQPIPMAVVTSIKIISRKKMKKNMLFAIDHTTEEVIVSESQKGSALITLIERIPNHKNELLYDAVVVLTKMTRSPQFDINSFKAMDEVCQMLYAKYADE